MVNIRLTGKCWIDNAGERGRTEEDRQDRTGQDRTREVKREERCMKRSCRAIVANPIPVP